LKAVPAEIWKTMLDLVNCKVLSIVESEDVDAYLLSESSMFVFPHKLILKTCGTTTLLCGLPRILEIAAIFGGYARSTAPPARNIAIAAAPYRVFYSRKNFLFPDRQRGPHRSWRDEVNSLDKLFLGGSAYMIGKMNGEHWYLYLTEPNTMLTPPASPCHSDSPMEAETKVLSLPTAVHGIKQGGICEAEDETLEVLMTDLHEENAKQFYLDHASAVAESQYRYTRSGSGDLVDVFSSTSSDNGEFASDEEAYPEELTTEGHALGTVVSDSCGLSDVYPKGKYPESRIDAYLFTPCGFSANAVVPAPEGETGTHYFTVHVTPEPNCSYASFETNVPALQKGRDTAEIVSNVVDIFKPGRFSVTLFEAKSTFEEKENDATDAEALFEIKALERKALRRSAKMEAIKGYRRVDRIVHDLDGYDLVFRYYERHDWKGGAPRIGERGF
jgi:S-adenosylmethionine decarboxylase